MSYDVRIGVKVEGMNGYIAVIDEPEYSEPTYNLRDMFVACMDWEYEQGEWYNCAEVLPKFQHGISELRFNRKKYTKYNPSNGWGSVDSAIEFMESFVQKIGEIVSGDWSWNEIPLEHCPFCGKPPKLDWSNMSLGGESDVSVTWRLRCDDCGYGMTARARYWLRNNGIFVAANTAYDDMIAKWNRRMNNG